MSADENGMVGLYKDRYRDLMKAERQLEAIKTYFENNLYTGAIVTGSHINDLRKILEGEG